MLINQAPLNGVDTEKEILQVENLYWAEMYEDLVALEKDPKFQRVILNGYFKDKAINGVSLLATDHVRRGGHRSDIMEQLIAISHLEDYFMTIKGLGSAPEELEDDEE